MHNNFICGYTPLIYDEYNENICSDDLFKTVVEPSISHRIPELKDVKVSFKRSNSGDIISITCTQLENTFEYIFFIF